MSHQDTIYVYEIPTIPDCTHHRLVTLCGGNVQERIFGAAEHLLRMVANFREGQLSLAVRFVFDPDCGSGVQNRLRLHVAVKVGRGVSEDSVRQLIDSGPLAEFYELNASTRPQHSFDLPCQFRAVCEVVRQEERVKPLITPEQNPGSIPKLYYSISALEARDDNDYSMADSLLSRMSQPCVVEMVVSPVDQSQDLEAQYKYITRLMSINEYGDDSSSRIEASSFLGEEPLEQQTALVLERKRDAMADDIAREHQEFHRTLRQPQLLFNIKAFAMNQENALMLASAVAESGLCNGKYRLLSYGHGEDEQSADWLEASHDDSCTMTQSLHAMCREVWNDDLPLGYRRMARLCRMATVDELKGLVRLPVGGLGSPRCIRKSTDPKGGTSANSILIGDDMEGQEPAHRNSGDEIANLATLFSAPNPTRLEQRLPLMALTKHMFVAGVPGSGKTTAVFNVLVQLARHGVPFLVIEPAKTEYRTLRMMSDHPDPDVRAMAADVRIYSPGNDGVSRFRFNPFDYPVGITLDEHISQVLACFEAAMPMGGPLQALIAEAIEEVYKGRSEDDSPQMADLFEATRTILESKSYEGEIQSNLRAMIEVRLGLLTRRAMGRIFDCRHSLPDIGELLAHPTIIEMDYLSQAHACLLTLFLLASMREQIRIDPSRRTKGLHHVTVIEEAHNIVGRSGPAKASEDNADPKAFAAQYVSRMLAELRALGEGIIIADQLPSTVAPEVVRNTGTKLAHRLVSNEDREDLGGAMLLGETEIEEIARLSPGEAYFYTEGLHRPRLVRCLNANEYLRLNDPPDNNTITACIRNEDWFSGNRPRDLSELCGNLRAALDTVREVVRHQEDAVQDLVARIDEARVIRLHGDEQAAKAPRQFLHNETLATRRVLEDVQRRTEARFDNLKLQPKPQGGGLEGAIAMLRAEWTDQVRPRLLELMEETRILESTILQQHTANTMEGDVK